MKLITEVVEDIDFFELEEAEGKKSLYLEGVFLQSELKNIFAFLSTLLICLFKIYLWLK